MTNLLIFITAIFLAIMLALLGAAIIKFVWFFTGMGEWTTMGPLPWGPAFFFALLLSTARSSYSRDS